MQRVQVDPVHHTQRRWLSPTLSNMTSSSETDHTGWETLKESREEECQTSFIHWWKIRPLRGRGRVLKNKKYEGDSVSSQSQRIYVCLRWCESVRMSLRLIRREEEEPDSLFFCPPSFSYSTDLKNPQNWSETKLYSTGKTLLIILVCCHVECD